MGLAQSPDVCYFWHRGRIVTGDGLVPKPVRWVGSSRDDLRRFPSEVRLRVGGALWEAQVGRKARWTKPLRGYGGADVLGVVDDHDGDTYRAVYTVRFAGLIYVLHAFQKKSKSGVATPRRDIALINQRLIRAREDYEQWLADAKTRSR